MQEKIPPAAWEIIAPAWVYLLSLLAAVVAFLEAVREELKTDKVISWKVRVFNFIAQIFSSALAAVLTHQVLEALGTPDKWQLPLVGIGAHMGTEALKLLGGLWKRHLKISANPLNDAANKE